jgi:hypothetical protein
VAGRRTRAWREAVEARRTDDSAGLALPPPAAVLETPRRAERFFEGGLPGAVAVHLASTGPSSDNEPVHVLARTLMLARVLVDRTAVIQIEARRVSDALAIAESLA